MQQACNVQLVRRLVLVVLSSLSSLSCRLFIGFCRRPCRCLRPCCSYSSSDPRRRLLGVAPYRCPCRCPRRCLRPRPVVVVVTATGYK